MVQMSHEYEDAHVHQAFVLRAHQMLDHSKTAHSLERGLKQATNPFLVLEVRREHLVTDVLHQIDKKSPDLKKPLKVRFVGGGEEGMDQGGVQKEFFQDLIDQLLDPIYGMFTYDTETRFSWFNPASLEHDSQFELIGTILGLALYNGVMLGVQFPRVMYKKLLDEPIVLDDIVKSFPVLFFNTRD